MFSATDCMASSKKLMARAVGRQLSVMQNVGRCRKLDNLNCSVLSLVLSPKS
jgi:hypothetical protein